MQRVKEKTRFWRIGGIEMIIDPPINELLDKVECRYSLVVVVSKRARQLVSGDAPLIDIDLMKSRFPLRLRKCTMEN